MNGETLARSIYSISAINVERVLNNVKVWWDASGFHCSGLNELPTDIKLIFELARLIYTKIEMAIQNREAFIQLVKDVFTVIRQLSKCFVFCPS